MISNELLILDDLADIQDGKERDEFLRLEKLNNTQSSHGKYGSVELSPEVFREYKQMIEEGE